jgi:diaminohydroxyphosphoribosylaminopyrimidine deaminase / 5-amino-6-(5-phosphoribosylamino)uracil reductase
MKESDNNRDIQFMAQAIALAKKAEGKTSPNPMVGAVVVDKHGRIIAEGYHKRAGAKHAEVIALERAGLKARGAALYVSLEPCSSYGKRPPCVEKILESGLGRIVIADLDPNPKNHNKGVKALKSHGLELKLGVLRKEARYLNRVFAKHIREGIPYVSLKAAVSLDGRIADNRGNSKWISSPDARRFVHKQIRAKVDAVMVGIGTVLKDNPRLTLRGPDNRLLKKQPLRAVLDSDLRVPLESKLLKPGGGQVIVVTSNKTKRAKKRRELRQRGVKVLDIDASGSKGLNLKRALQELYRDDICHILVEGGSSLLSSFLEQRLADYIYLFISNMVLGGDYLMYNGREFKLDKAPKIVNRDFQVFDNSIMVSGEIKNV